MKSSISRRAFGASLFALAPAARALPAERSVDDVLRDGITARRIPAAAGMFASSNKVLYAGAFGTRNAGGPPLAVDSIFAIASMTKAVTTVAALQLVEQGKLTLDEPVGKLLPQLAQPMVLAGFERDSGKPILRPAK